MLIFCSSRKGCESTARHVAKFLRKFPVSVHNDKNESIDVMSAIDALGRSPAGLDPILEETLPFGVAYHHAGLTVCLLYHIVSGNLCFSITFLSINILSFIG